MSSSTVGDTTPVAGSLSGTFTSSYTEGAVSLYVLNSNVFPDAVSEDASAKSRVAADAGLGRAMTEVWAARPSAAAIAARRGTPALGLEVADSARSAVRVDAGSLRSVDGSAAETIAVFLAVLRADGTDPVFATGTRDARALTANMPRVGGVFEGVGTGVMRLSKRREAAREAGRGHRAVGEW